MPIDYRIDEVLRTVRTTCTGYVTLPEVLEHFDALQADPGRPAYLHVVLDLSHSTSLPESDQLRAVAQRIGRSEGMAFGACAIVTQSDALFGMLRVFEVFTEPYFTATQVFRDLTSAEEWLDAVRKAQSGPR